MKTFMPLLFAGLIFTTIVSCHKSTTTAITGNWVGKGEFNGVVRSEAVSFVINDTAYVGTGYDGNNRLTDIWAYNAGGDSWYQKADMPGTPRNSAVAFAAAGKGYITTGYDGVNMLNDTWEFNPIANTWTKKADFAGSPRYDAVAFGVGDKGYVGTGFDGTYLKDFYQYDPTSDTWTLNIGYGGNKRKQAVAFVYQNKAYVATGVNNGSYQSDFWSYDPSTSKWAQLRNTANTNSTESYDDAYGPIDRANAVSFIIGDKAYLSTGENPSLLASTWEYDFATDLWVAKQDFERPADVHVEVAVRVAHGDGHARLGREMTDERRPESVDDAVDPAGVDDVDLLEARRRGHVLAKSGAEVVEGDDLVAAGEKTVADV